MFSQCSVRVPAFIQIQGLFRVFNKSQCLLRMENIMKVMMMMMISVTDSVKKGTLNILFLTIIISSSNRYFSFSSVKNTLLKNQNP